MEHKQHAQGKIGHESNLKYTEGMDNAAKLDKNGEALASFVKKHKAKH